MRCHKCNHENIKDSAYCRNCGFKLILIGDYPLLNGRYKVIELLGSGGMSTVLKANDNKEKDRVRAVKEMACDFKKHEDRIYAVQKFKEEAAILSRISHPGIPVVTDYFVENDRYYLVMDCIEGKTLEEILRDMPVVSEDMLKDIALQVCDTLEYLHGQPTPIIHRDLKPSNFLIEHGTGKVVIIDFGIAKKIVEQETGTLVGTPGYMAPEQYTGRIDKRTDIFGLGATLHHVITGRNPADKGMIDFSPVSEFRPDISGHMEMIIRKALESDPEKRFQSATEFKKAIIQEDYKIEISEKKSAEKPASLRVLPGYVKLFDKNRIVPTGEKAQKQKLKKDIKKDATEENISHVQLHSFLDRENIKNKLKDYIGIDIGSYSIKILQMSIDDKYFMYPSKVIVIPTPSETMEKGIIKNPSKIGQLILKAFSDCNIKAKVAVTAIPGERSYFKTCIIKEVSGETLRKNVYHLASQVFPFYSKECIIDYQPLHNFLQSQKGNMEVIMAGAEKEVTESLNETIKESGIEFIRIKFQPFLLNQAISLIAGENIKSRGLMVVDMGAESTGLNVIKEGYLWMTKTLPVGGNTFTGIIAKEFNLDFKKAESLKLKHLNLAINTSATETEFRMLKLSSELLRTFLEEIRKLSEDLAIKYEIPGPLPIFLCGGTSLMRNLDRYIENSLRVRCFKFRMPVSKDITINTDAVSPISPVFMVAFGLAMDKVLKEEKEEKAVKTQKEAKKGLRDILRFKFF